MKLLDAALDSHVTQGSLDVVYADGARSRFGEQGAEPIVVRFTDRKAPWDVMRDPRLGAGEMYMEGRMTIDPPHDVYDLVDLITRNGAWERPGQDRKLMGKRTGRIMARLERYNARNSAKRNVAHHYDLDDRLYDLFLDADRQYSCAYFTDPGNGLDQAQADKKAHIAAKLYLKPGQRVLDIGCGWGGMALYLNRVADVDVLGVTLSEEQLKVARRRAEEAGVADRVRFELTDYRDVTGSFDRIVSVGMFEHVGAAQHRIFFNTCRNLLTPDGVALIHTIAHVDGPSATDPWTAKYIFPGGYIPALSDVAPSIEDSGLWLTDLEILRLHYAQTLDHWYDRTEAVRDKIIALYDERFLRMWEFYLAGAITGFRHDGLANFQIQLTRRRDALPLTRDYMLAAEHRLHETVGDAIAAE
ncbi:MAG TPA: cyclopropane-fatty-acyl-phospholipid synthase family protein [Sphingomonadaceae bacterium]|nr:cyclopropane-fatty-acyl-phospholipid synthase family protein [Sphingomonadaceae bacterium]